MQGALQSFKNFVSTTRGKVTTAVIVLLLLGMMSSCTAAFGEGSVGQTPEPYAQEEVQTSTLSYTVRADGWTGASNDHVVLRVEGTSADGKTFDKKLKAKPGTKYDLELSAGEYTFTLAEESPVVNSTFYKAEPKSVSFDGKTYEHVLVTITPDEEATQAYLAEQEAKRVAAEQEVQAKAEAEAKAKAEAEAAAKAQAEAQAAAEAKAAAEAQAAAQAQAQKQSAAKQSDSGSSGGGTVYVASSGSGKKYHSNPGCSNMKGTNSMSVSKAQSLGYTPCKKCY